MIRRPPRSTLSSSSAASDVYKRQLHPRAASQFADLAASVGPARRGLLSLIHISEPTRLLSISYAVFCLKQKNTSMRLHATVGASIYDITLCPFSSSHL